MNVLILCGGRGIRLLNESTYIPKGMVRLGHRPMLWHIMKRFSLAGHNRFILALGSGGEAIRDYFMNYDTLTNDVRMTTGTGKVEMMTKNQEERWNIAFVDTGETVNSGARIHRVKQYIEGDDFFITYADTLGDVDLSSLAAFHRSSKKTLTLTGVVPPYREGELLVSDHLAVGPYEAKKDTNKKTQRLVNGGYMLANKRLFAYLNAFSECRLESEAFAKLIEKKELAVFPHHGFWRWLDTDRDYLYLRDLVDKNNMYWLQEGGAG